MSLGVAGSQICNVHQLGQWGGDVHRDESRLGAKRCIERGAAPVFISEQAKGIFKVKDYPGIIDDLGYHVEIAAMVDESAKTISVQKVKRLSYEGATCARPKKIGANE
jgi:hypothetical protein